MVLKSSHNFRILKWFNFVQGFTPFGAIAVLYFVHITGSYALAMTLFTVASLTTTFLEIPTGVISDRIGRKKTIIAGATITLASLIFYALAGSFWILAIGAVLEGLAYSLYSGNNDALLYESLEQEGEQHAFAGYQGKISSLSSISNGIAALASGFIVSIAFVYLPLISAVFAALALAIVVFVREPRVHTNKIETNIYSHVWDSLKQFKNNIQLRNLSIASTLDWGLGGSASMFRPAFVATLWPVWAVGIARVLGNVTYALSSWFSDKILGKTGNERWLLFGSLVKSIIRLFSYGLPTVASPALLAGENLIVASMHNAQDALMQNEYSVTQRATMASLNSLMGNLFFGICCIAMGYAADRIGAAPALFISEVLCLPILFLYYSVLKNRKRIAV
ncbi:MAG: MFS transporter [bacterium]|nr:MFS transporter [bacterium]